MPSCTRAASGSIPRGPPPRAFSSPTPSPRPPPPPRPATTRGGPEALASGAAALAAARHGVERGYDRLLLPVERLFMYLPFEHSERLEDQELACALCEPLRAYAETDDTHRYALAHRDVIRRFGRFPHRNAVLGRESTPEELEFLKQPGSSF